MITIDNWLIYGASGYTAKLIIDEAIKRGHQPILAGRSETTVLPTAEAYKLPYRIFPSGNAHQISQHLDDVGVVLNCAGPFEDTATPIRGACLEKGVHYLDITGEMTVLADGLALDQQAKDKGVAFISGVGFDVVPTDVLAVKLRELAPNADTLELAFAGAYRKEPAFLTNGQENTSSQLIIEHDDGTELSIASPDNTNGSGPNSGLDPDSSEDIPGGISPGTSKTMLRMLPELGWVRKDGVLKQVPLAAEQKWIQFDDTKRHCMSIPWGDIETAYVSAGFDNIIVFTQAAPDQAKWMRRISPLAGMFRWSWLQKFADKMIDKHIQGPDLAARQEAQMTLAGKALDSKNGQEVNLYARCDDGYDFTVTASLFFVESLLAHKILPGAYTPTQAVEADELIEMLGIELTEV